MEGLLTPVSTSYKSPQTLSENELVESRNPAGQETGTLGNISTPEEALQILQSEPGFPQLARILSFLSTEAPSKREFSIVSPSPTTAQLVHVLVTSIIPAYWTLLQEHGDDARKRRFKYVSERKMLLRCLRSVTGLNAVATQMRAAVQQSREKSLGTTSSGPLQVLKDLFEVLEAVLNGTNVVEHLWQNVLRESPQRKRALWHETVNLIAGGRVLNIAAEGLSIVKEILADSEAIQWIADGVSYSRWLVQNVKYWIKKLSPDDKDSWKGISDTYSKSLHLGYRDMVVNEALELLLVSNEEKLHFEGLIQCLAGREQRLLVLGGLQFLSKRCKFQGSDFDDSEWWKSEEGLVSSAARFLKDLVADQSGRKEILSAWLTELSGAGVGAPIGIRRAAIAIFSGSKNDLDGILEKSLQQFGDELYIKHTPMLQQEVHTQVILLVAGYLHRTAPLKISILLRSSIYLNAVSRRLAASSERARYLGMVVGEALSALVEKGDKKMNFKMEELELPEAKWYKSLVNVSDKVGSTELLKASAIQKAPPRRNVRDQAPTKKSRQQQGYTKIISIEEVEDDEKGDAEDDDLIPYAKPDTDPEDSDEDPTLVQKNKPTAPVYIRDLITYLRDTENYDKQKLALNTAPVLIRRKANFGTEVTEHAEELATLLVGLQNKFDLDDFQDMRLQGMIAVLISQPSNMGKWFARTFFEGDFSVSQRTSVLTVLSVGARELAGYQAEDASLTKLKIDPTDQFPSKRLIPRLHALYASSQEGEENAIDALSTQLTNTMLQPVANSVADEVTGPNVLKVRTFSSRMEVEGRRKPATVNALAAIAADSFFFPLTGRFFAHFKVYGPGNVIFEPFLLSNFLKTLALILWASGPSTLQLPQMTNEMWDLLMSLRVQAQEERSVGKALLLGFLTILEVNQDTRRLAELHGRDLLETQKWVELFFQSVGQGSAEDDQMRALAAGVLYKIKEVVEKYQALLIGELASF